MNLEHRGAFHYEYRGASVPRQRTAWEASQLMTGQGFRSVYAVDGEPVFDPVVGFVLLISTEPNEDGHFDQMVKPLVVSDGAWVEVEDADNCVGIAAPEETADDWREACASYQRSKSRTQA